MLLLELSIIKRVKFLYKHITKRMYINSNSTFYSPPNLFREFLYFTIVYHELIVFEIFRV